jgi:DNA polymerase-3 subunit alpha
MSVDEMDRVIAEEEAEAKKWDKYRNIWKYPKIADPPMLPLDKAEAIAAKLPKIADSRDFATKKLHGFTIAGILTQVKPHQTKKGDDMAFGSLQDEHGAIDLVFFPRTWKSCKDIVAENEMIAFKGVLEGPNEMRKKSSFQVSSIQDINKLVKAAAQRAADSGGEEAGKESAAADANNYPSSEQTYSEIHIRLTPDAASSEENLTPLRDYLYGASGACQVFIHVPLDKGEAVVHTTTAISAPADEAGMEAIRKCGVAAEVWRK